MSFGVDFFSTVVTGYVVLDVLPSDTNKKKKYQNDAKAINAINETLSENELIKVMHCKSSKEVWDKLGNIYEGDLKVKKAKLQTYRMRFESLIMKEDETITKYLRTFETMTNLIKSIDLKFEYEVIFQKIMGHLPTRFYPNASVIKK